MVAKIIEGKHFGGCVGYVLKDRSEIIHAEGLRTTSARTITQDFNLQRKLNPRLGKAVGHIVLSWSEHDKGKLTNRLMAGVALEYLKSLDIDNTQYLMVRHHDRKHDHVHIVYNRVDNQGKTIANSNLRFRSVKLCKQLNSKYGFYQASGKEKVNRGRLKGADKAKYEIHDALKTALRACGDWKQLESYLKYKGVAIQYKKKANSDEVQGVSFSKSGYTFKGSEVDRSLSYGKIDRLFNGQEVQQSAETDTNLTNHQAIGISPMGLAMDAMVSLLDIGIAHDQDDDAIKRKNRNRR
ncbi:Relaxase/Mobilisation nuclease domain-containing protein [Parapedobacter composti]|uniref:Relaxase/Mobilisation nuclease domain-containing protein n=1 Tax=Parapedobacter composti TaxID=623281 RepID=A0A1I1I4T0_9SPHI|nr:relaxase/mobilization nuclease domain-containing protein [Parapedobacter composti]SFC31055.1 Relaxase/Mobilisation nuclease domain-containing protein [Parapedobacter composti]